MMAEQAVVKEEVEKEENIVLVPEVDAEGNPIEVVIKPELDDEGNPIEAAEKPAWMNDVDETDKPVETAPLGALKFAKQKYKDRLSERDAENERLRLENERLKSSAQTPSGFDSIEIPMENDFDTDEEYKAARRKYDTELRNDILKNATQTNTQNVQQENQQRQQIKAVEDHISRAEIFIKENKITPEVYLSADENIRQALEAIRPGAGNQIKNDLINIIGDDSEKVFFHIGRSKKRLDELTTSLVNDPSGLSTARLVGEFKTVVKPTKKQISQARKPAAQAVGGSATPAAAKALKKKFDAAKTPQEAWDIRKLAKAKKFDVKEW